MTVVGNRAAGGRHLGGEDGAGVLVDHPHRREVAGRTDEAVLDREQRDR